jgi:hypothetical protein
MEQIMECLLAEMKASQEEMMARMEANQEKTDANLREMKAHREGVEANQDGCLSRKAEKRWRPGWRSRSQLQKRQRPQRSIRKS